MSSYSPSGGMKLMLRSVSNLLSLTHCRVGWGAGLNGEPLSVSYSHLVKGAVVNGNARASVPRSRPEGQGKPYQWS